MKKSLIVLIGIYLLLFEINIFAQSYPTRPVKIIVPYPPGGATDIAARLIAGSLTEAFGQAFTVENRPGAGGMIALDQVASAAPDGYTLLVASTGPIAISPVLYKDRNFNPLTKMDGIILFASAPGIIVSRNNLKVRDIKELITLSKASPNSLTMASAGNGSFQHLLGVYFQNSLGIKWTHIPFKGSSPALNEMMGDRVDVMIDVIPSAAPMVKAGRLRALAVTTPKRSSQLPNVPTLEELGYKGFDKSGWHALFGPKGMPIEIVTKMNNILNKSLNTPDMQLKLGAIGADAEGGTPEKLNDRLRTELREWAQVIQLSGTVVE
jgi:tripartite-type tricarboxylate transporter receptor subunit TctC